MNFIILKKKQKLAERIKCAPSSIVYIGNNRFIAIHELAERRYLIDDKLNIYAQI